MTDIVERLRKWSNVVPVPPAADTMGEAATEIVRLREAIRRLADQDGTLSVQGGSVTVTMDATLTDAERDAVKWCRDNIIPMSSSASAFAFIHTATLRKLLDRLHT